MFEKKMIKKGRAIGKNEISYIYLNFLKIVVLVLVVFLKNYSVIFLKKYDY